MISTFITGAAFMRGDDEWDARGGDHAVVFDNDEYQVYVQQSTLGEYQVALESPDHCIVFKEQVDAVRTVTAVAMGLMENPTAFEQRALEGDDR